MSDFLRDIAKFNKKLEKILDEAKSQKALEPLGRIAIDIIRNRTRKGKGISENGGTLQTLKPLSKSYKDYRRRNSGRLSSFTSVGKSNLTFTGSMLTGLRQKRSNNATIITFDTARNRKVAGFVSEKRPFLFLAIDEIGQLVKNYEKYFQGLVRSRNR